VSWCLALPVNSDKWSSAVLRPGCYPIARIKQSKVIPADDIRTHRGRRGVAPLSLNLGTR